MNFSKRAKHLAYFLAIYFCLAPTAKAQTGLPPFGALQSGGFDTVNLQNLNVNFAIPIMSSQGRDLPLSYSMFHNTGYWLNGAAWYPSVDQNGNPIWGWNLPGQLGTITYQTEILTTYGCGSPTHYYNFVFTDRFGTGHAFNSIYPGSQLNYYSTNTCSLTLSDQGYATDGSGLTMYSTGGVSRVTTPTGTTQIGSTLTNNNGNYISQNVVSSSETDWTDSIGRTALKVITSGTTTTVKWLDQTNSYQSTTIISSSFNIKTNYGIPGMSEYAGTADLPTEVDLPNGRKYLFTYETTPGYSGYTTGRLNRITFPTGGYYQYDYPALNDGVDPVTGAQAYLTRTINDGTSSVQWQYSRAHVGTNWVTTVTAPQMPYDSAPNQSVFTFNSSGQETQELYYQGIAGIGTLLREIDKTWATNGTPATQITTLADTNQKSEVATTYDGNGNLTQVYEYDWGTAGSGTVGSLIRGTTLGYSTSPGPPNRLSEKLITDGSGTAKYLETRDYDEAALTNVTGAGNHDDTTYGSSYNYRGNLTTLKVYADPVTPAGPVTQTFTYDTLGNVLTTSLGGVLQQTLVYSSATQYSAPDSITNGPTSGPQLTTQYTYNPYTSQIVSVKDTNLQTTTFTYDVFKRPIATTRSDGTPSTTTYNDTYNTVSSATEIDSSHSAIKVVALDGLGRPITTTLEDASSTAYSITQTQYDPAGRAYRSSNPYTGSPSYWTTAQLDAVGRPIATILPDGSQNTASYSGPVITSGDPSGKQRKSKLDAVGRLIEVDEPSGTVTLGAGSGSVTVSGTEYHHSATGATAGHGTVTIAGSEQFDTEDNPTYDCFMVDCGGNCFEWRWNDHYTTYSDQGQISITVNGHTNTVGYGAGWNSSSLASSLTSQINSDSGAYVTATVSGAVITLTAKATGAASNYVLNSLGWSTDTTGYFWGTSFSATSSNNLLTSGADATSASYDSGTVSLTVDGKQVSVSYGSSSSAPGLATSLASAVNGASLPVAAIASGATITLTATTAGASTNYSISAESFTVNSPDYFVGIDGPSFRAAPSGATLTGGVGPDSWSSPVATTYAYNVLNQLTGVTQGSQSRGYVYDGIGRLTGTTTPEAGTVSFTYNSMNLVGSFTDARSVVTNYSYDTLNRRTGVSYNASGTGVAASPSVSYAYGTSSSSHNNGRLTTMTDGPGSEAYSYDALGRLIERDKVIGGTTYSTEYAYNLANELTLITYPSGTTQIAQSYDSLGRLCGVGASGSTCSSGTTYASGISYNAAQEITGFTYGNGISANFGYSADRLQINSLSYANGSTTLFSLNYNYGPSGVNNGKIASITDNADSGRTATYGYDGLGRLSTAATPGSTGYPAWGFSWGYDRYGNRTSQSILSGCTGGVSCLTDSLTVGATTNQVTGSPFAYDASGNMTNDSLNTMVYDAAGKLISSTNGSSSGAYAYDGHGLRVQKCVPNCTSPTTKTVYIFSGSRVLAEYDNGATVASPTREYVYASGKRVARFASSATNYYHQDHLSTRLITNPSGSVIESMGHFPFGEYWYDTGNEKGKFTTYERDAESSNDYALARYLVNRLGRFSSPDLHAGRLANPQSLNRYTYVLNDPINLFDPFGLDAEEAPRCWWDNSPDGLPGDEGGADKADCVSGGGTWVVHGDDGSINVTFWDEDLGGIVSGVVSIAGSEDSTQDTNPEEPEEPSLDNSQDLPTPEEIAQDPLHQLFTNNPNCPNCGTLLNTTDMAVKGAGVLGVAPFVVAPAAPSIVTAAVAVSETTVSAVTIAQVAGTAIALNPTTIDIVNNTLDFLNDVYNGDPVFTVPVSTGSKFGLGWDIIKHILGWD